MHWLIFGDLSKEWPKLLKVFSFWCSKILPDLIIHAVFGRWFYIHEGALSPPSVKLTMSSNDVQSVEFLTTSSFLLSSTHMRSDRMDMLFNLADEGKKIWCAKWEQLNFFFNSHTDGLYESICFRREFWSVMPGCSSKTTQHAAQYQTSQTHTNTACRLQINSHFAVSVKL